MAKQHRNHLFEVVTKENSAVMNLSDKLGRTPAVEWTVAQGTRGIAYAVLAYARSNGLNPADVQYSYRNM